MTHAAADSGGEPDERAGIRTILLATDLSSASANAEELAFELATRLGGALRLVMGSVSEQVVRTSPVPVVVARKSLP